MSASRDKSQKTTFVYSNLYQLYRKGKAAAGESSPSVDTQPSYFEVPSARNVLKVGDLKAGAQPAGVPAEVKIDPFSPPELIGKRLETRAIETRLASSVAEKAPSGKPAHPTQDAALLGLKQNLMALQDLHTRLRFMLKELEALGEDE